VRGPFLVMERTFGGKLRSSWKGKTKNRRKPRVQLWKLSSSKKEREGDSEPTDFGPSGRRGGIWEKRSPSLVDDRVRKNGRKRGNNTRMCPNQEQGLCEGRRPLRKERVSHRSKEEGSTCLPQEGTACPGEGEETREC